MALIIRKRISLDFLGDEYKDAYIVFKSIPIKDFGDLQDEINKIGDDNKKSLNFILDKLKEYFISGESPNEAGSPEAIGVDDLGNLDQQSVIKCFQTLTGQSINEENDFLDKESTKPSQTAQPSQSN